MPKRCSAGLTLSSGTLLYTDSSCDTGYSAAHGQTQANGGNILFRPGTDHAYGTYRQPDSNVIRTVTFGIRYTQSNGSYRHTDNKAVIRQTDETDDGAIRIACSKRHSHSLLSFFGFHGCSGYTKSTGPLPFLFRPCVFRTAESYGSFSGIRAAVRVSLFFRCILGLFSFSCDTDGNVFTAYSVCRQDVFLRMSVIQAELQCRSDGKGVNGRQRQTGRLRLPGGKKGLSGHCGLSERLVIAVYTVIRDGKRGRTEENGRS